MRVLSAALRGNIGYGALDYFQQRLLDALTAYISCNGGVLAAAGYLVNFVNVDYAALSRLDIVIGSLHEPQQHVLNVLSDIARLRKRCGVRDSERHIQQSRQRLCEHCLTNARRTEQQNVGLLKFNVVCLIAVEEGALIVIVYGDRKHLFGLVLSDYIVVKVCLDLLRGHKLIGT